MNSNDFPNLRTRRDFFRQASCAALGTLGVTSALRDLRLINAAVAQTGGFSDYKALVCVFLGGGNDSNNLIVPIGASDYSNYSAVRQVLAIPQASLLPIPSLNPDGHDYGLHPSCIELQTLFAEQKCAFLLNAGTLLYPITKAQYQAKSVPTPPQLFSHSDQVTQWQTSIPDQPPKTGWGGRIADRLHPLQYQLAGDGTPTPTSAKISLCTSIAGANTFEVGDIFQQYHVSTSGAVTVSGVAGNRLQALKDVLAVNSTNLQRQAFADVTRRAIDTGDLLNAAIGATSSPTYWTVPFPGSSLGNQLKMVARLIEARTDLNMQRQIFFVTVGGYDTHTAQVGTTGGLPDATIGAHANLLNEVSEGLFAFLRAMEQLGTSNNVTAFTASDFGRTFPSNGQGSDHGWGSHHIVVGGAVKGKKTYGTLPVHQVSGPDDTSTGRWIPKISIDEYSATLAKWFGVSTSDLQVVFPNLGRFNVPDVGFMT
jgi:uncharacterized protein (DUF1501 family)